MHLGMQAITHRIIRSIKQWLFATDDLRRTRRPLQGTSCIGHDVLSPEGNFVANVYRGIKKMRRTVSSV